MKTLTKILFLLAFVALVTPGCEKAKDLLDVKFKADFKTDLNVDIPAGTLRSLNASFYEEATIDPNSNSDFAQYANNIKDIQINGVTAKVLAINKNVTLTSTNLTVSSTGLNSGVWTYSNLPITVGTELTLGNENGQWDNVQAILNSQNVFTVVLSGEADQDDVQFTLEVTISTTITANPIGG